MEIHDLKGASSITRWHGESNESMYEKCGMVPCANRVKCGIEE